MKSFEQFIDKDFGICKILFRKEVKLENVCLFASHTFSLFMPEYIYYYLREIKKSGLSLIFISSSEISEADFQKLLLFSDIIIEKENKGVDFGAWCSVLRYLDYCKSCQSLYLCNDSVFGPLIPFLEIHKKFLSLGVDVLGITDSLQGKYHIQSYFVGLKTKVLQTPHWAKFWSELSFQNERAKVIAHHEIGLSEILFNGDLKCFIWADWLNKINYKNILTKVSQSEVLRHRWLSRVLYEQNEILVDINPNSFLWKELITLCQSPFIKRELFIYANLFEECEIEGMWEPVLLEHSSYPVGLIKYFLIDYFLNKDLRFRLNKFGEFKLSTGNTENKNPSFEKQINFSAPFFLFDAIESLTEFVPITLPAEESQWIQELQGLNIRCLLLQLHFSGPKYTTCIFIYLTEDIVELNQASLTRIKHILKGMINPIVVVQDMGIAAIASNLLSLRYEAIVDEKEFINPAANKKISDKIKRTIEIYETGRLYLSERPVLSEVVKDAANGTNQSRFIADYRETSEKDIRSSDLTLVTYDPAEEYGRYITIKNKYLKIYESTPVWYKKIGQIIKLLKGNKRLTINFKDKGEKNIYKSTAEDIAHWYYLQYEVLPGWYKKIGKMLIKRK